MKGLLVIGVLICCENQAMARLFEPESAGGDIIDPLGGPGKASERKYMHAGYAEFIGSRRRESGERESMNPNDLPDSRFRGDA